MAYTDKMELQFDVEVTNLTNAEKYKIFDGKPATISVRRGVPNSIFMSISARYSQNYGSNPSPDNENAQGTGLKAYTPGFPNVTNYQYTWTVDVDDSSKIYTIGTPKEVVWVVHDFPFTTKKVSMNYDKSNTNSVAVNMEISYDYMINPTSSGKQQFMCRLLAEKPKEPPKPKIRKETVVVGSFAFGDSTVQKIKSLGSMLDYSKLSAWYNKLPERTRESILNSKPPGGQKIVLTGYTDNVSDEHLNFALGTKRAVAVLQTLEKISGVKWKDIAATPSKGEQDVRVEQKNLEKKEPKHRRVEITLTIEE